MSLSDAVARARGIAAEKGISYDSRGRNGSTSGFRYCSSVLIVDEVSVLTTVQHRAERATPDWLDACSDAQGPGRDHLPAVDEKASETTTTHIVMSAAMSQDALGTAVSDHFPPVFEVQTTMPHADMAVQKTEALQVVALRMTTWKR